MSLQGFRTKLIRSSNIRRRILEFFVEQFKLKWWLKKLTHDDIIEVKNRTCVIEIVTINVVKVISIPLGTALKGKNSLPLGANSFL